MAAVQSLTASFATTSSYTIKRTDVQMSYAAVSPRVGEYTADYSELGFDEISASDDGLEDILSRSKVVSVKRGL